MKDFQQSNVGIDPTRCGNLHPLALFKNQMCAFAGSQTTIFTVNKKYYVLCLSQSSLLLSF